MKRLLLLLLFVTQLSAQLQIGGSNKQVKGVLEAVNGGTGLGAVCSNLESGVSNGTIYVCTDILTEAELDTFAELDAQIADQTLIHSGSNIATASALAANGSNCSAGNYPLGVDAAGAVEDCTTAVSQLSDLSDVTGTTGTGTTVVLSTGPTIANLLTLSSASNPLLNVTDTTNPTTVSVFSGNTIAQVGTSTDHTLSLIANSISRLDLETDDDVAWGTGLEASATHTFAVTGSPDPTITFSADLMHVDSSEFQVTPTAGRTFEFLDGSYRVEDETASSTAPTQVYYKARGASTSANDDDIMGRIDFAMLDSGLGEETGVRIDAVVSDVTNGTEDSRIDFDTITDGARGTILSMGDSLQLHDVSNSKPTCAVAHRFKIWVVAGAGGVKDTVEVCAKDAGDAYAWRTIY